MSKELVEELRATFDYHPGGYLIRRSTGEPCGQRANRSDGRVHVRVGKSKLYAHRIIYAIVYGRMPEGVIKHVNGYRMDNRIENLREIPRSEPRRNPSVFPGVHWHGIEREWVSHILVEDQRIHLGYFADFDDAVEARKIAEIRYHPTSPEAAKFARELFPCGA